MKKASISESYRRYLAEKLEEIKQHQNPSMSVQKISDVTGIQRTHLSAVFNKRQHANSDQLYLIMQALSLDSDEQETVVTLWEWERTKIPIRKMALKAKIESKSLDDLDTKNYLKPNQRQESDFGSKMLDFYSSFEAQLLHLAFEIESFSENPNLLRETLRMQEPEFQRWLSILDDLRLIEKKKGQIQNCENTLHLAKNSPYFAAYRNTMKLKALSKHLGSEKSEKDFSFTALFSANENFRSQFHQKLLELLKWAQSESERVKAHEGVYQISVDLLKWI